MARFIFKVDGCADHKEIDLPDLAAAKCEALRYASNMVCDQQERFWNAREFQLTVTDQTGLALFALTISGIEAPAIRVEPIIPA
jgi:hypothetical protein